MLIEPSSRWWENAACAGAPLNDFFPACNYGRITKNARVETDRVIDRYCARCPVRTECLLEILDVAEIRVAEAVGIRGGYLFIEGMSRRQVTERRAAHDSASGQETPACACRRADCDTCGPRLTVAAANNRVGSGTGVTRGSDLHTVPYTRRPADPEGMRVVAVEPVRSVVAANAGVDERLRRRTAEVKAAHEALKARGGSWRDVQVWARRNGYSEADLKIFNPIAVSEYVATVAPNEVRSKTSQKDANDPTLHSAGV